jgi:hypothetical protein
MRTTSTVFSTRERRRGQRRDAGGDGGERWRQRAARAAQYDHQGAITANYGIVEVLGTIEGGTLTTESGGVMESLRSSAVLDGVTLSSGSTYTGGTGTTTELEGTITNTGATVSASGGTIEVAGTVDGGTLSTSSGGVMESLGAGAILDGVTISSGRGQQPNSKGPSPTPARPCRPAAGPSRSPGRLTAVRSARAVAALWRVSARARCSTG